MAELLLSGTSYYSKRSVINKNIRLEVLRVLRAERDSAGNFKATKVLRAERDSGKKQFRIFFAEHNTDFIRSAILLPVPQF